MSLVLYNTRTRVCTYKNCEFVCSPLLLLLQTSKDFQFIRLLTYIDHRGLKLDGAIGQGEICNSLKSEKISKSFLSHIGKNKIKF